MGAVRVEEAAAVRAQHLDRLLRGDRAHGEDLFRAFQRRQLAVREQVLQHSLRDEEERVEERDGQEHVDRGAHQVDPKVADRLAAKRPRFARQASRDGKGHGDSRGGGGEVVPRQPGHLREVADGGLRHIRLPVGVGREARGGVERERRLHCG